MYKCKFHLSRFICHFLHRPTLHIQGSSIFHATGQDLSLFYPLGLAVPPVCASPMLLLLANILSFRLDQLSCLSACSVSPHSGELVSTSSVSWDIIPASAWVLPFYHYEGVFIQFSHKTGPFSRAESMKNAFIHYCAFFFELCYDYGITIIVSKWI